MAQLSPKIQLSMKSMFYILRKGSKNPLFLDIFGILINLKSLKNTICSKQIKQLELGILFTYLIFMIETYSF